MPGVPPVIDDVVDVTKQAFVTPPSSETEAHSMLSSIADLDGVRAEKNAEAHAALSNFVGDGMRTGSTLTAYC